MTFDTLKKLFSFSWPQAFSDQNGKSSIVPISGFYLVVVGGIGFLYSLFLKDVNGMMYSTIVVGTGAGLLGYHKKVDGKPESLGVTDDKSDIPNQP